MMRWLPEGSPYFSPTDIRIWRAQELLTQAQACEFFSVSRLAYWEAGKMLPAAFNRRFCEALARYYRLKDLARPPVRRTPLGYRRWAERGSRRISSERPG